MKAKHFRPPLLLGVMLIAGMGSACLARERRPTQEQARKAAEMGDRFDQALEKSITAAENIVDRLKKTKKLYDFARSKVFISAQGVRPSLYLLEEADDCIKKLEEKMRQLREESGVWVDSALKADRERIS